MEWNFPLSTKMLYHNNVWFSLPSATLTRQVYSLFKWKLKNLTCFYIIINAPNTQHLTREWINRLPLTWLIGLDWIGACLVEKMQTEEQIDRGRKMMTMMIKTMVIAGKQGAKEPRGVSPPQTAHMKVSNLAINDPPTVGWRESQNQIVHGTKQMVCKIKQEKTQEPTVHTMFSGFPITILFFLSFHHHKSHHPYHLHFLTSPFTTVMVFFESKSKLKIKC